MLVGYPQLLAGASGADPLRLVGMPNYTECWRKAPRWAPLRERVRELMRINNHNNISYIPQFFRFQSGVPCCFQPSVPHAEDEAGRVKDQRKFPPSMFA